MPSTRTYWASLENGVSKIKDADAVLIGAGAGLSASAGLVYSGKRFEDNFADFIKRYGLSDMYSAGFYPFKTLEERWAYWSRHIWLNRYQPGPLAVYQKLLQLMENKDYFVLTTNVDHCFQKADFDKERLFYTQGDYGLWQCSVPCHDKTYDNREAVEKMVSEQRDMRIPPELIPYCPKCGAPMTMNLRIDNTFVEDSGWHEAAARYKQFVLSHRQDRIVYLELGVGDNTPVIIKYPFWEMTKDNPNATYISINKEDDFYPAAIRDRTIKIQADIGAALDDMLAAKDEGSMN